MAGVRAKADKQDAEALLAETVSAQAEASDPTVSAWVSANAGAGKTHVLKRRVLRILLAGTPPARILCLTYTKAAAAEMQTRVFGDLAMWATTSQEKLVEELSRNVLGRAPTAKETAEARKLFARAIETPGGLKVQTIHAFCERLLQRFPLEAGVPPGFSILDDAEGMRLRREATDEVLGLATRDRGSSLGRALDVMIAFATGDGFDQALRGALAKRDWLEAVARWQIGGEDGDEDGLNRVGAMLLQAFGVRESDLEDDGKGGGARAAIEREMASVMSGADIKRAVVALGEGGKTDAKLAEALAAAASAEAKADVAGQIAAFQGAFLTAKMEARSDRFVTKAVLTKYPEDYERLVRARDAFAALHLERQGLVVAEASLALMQVAGEVMQRYTRAKARRAMLDFDDLVRRTARLLSSSDAAEWVLYKLDGGLDHILVDEAQDTSQVQWSVIGNLAQEFFAGSGARDEPRTMFAVGDEKQSIYSFQGAEPRMFAQTGAAFKQRAAAARLAWRTVPLTLSFRTVAPLLDAVDGVFSDALRTPGVGAESGSVRHQALRIGQAGGLEIWDTEKPEILEAADAWLPLEEAFAASPVTRLAARIADTIKGWIESGERLVSQDRPIRAGDVVILLRRRRPFAGPMVAALKARKIPVAGADRLQLMDQIAVKDLVALGRFLTLPEDDLSLAEVLKSPLIGLDDDDLMGFAPERRGTLWRALLDAAKTNVGLQPAVETLLHWRGTADQAPPFEFFAQVLDRDGGRGRLIKRLGPETVDAITEFLNLSLAYDEAEPPSLTGFLEWLGSGTREIKRDMEHGRDEVRVLTVHGAKGLEAPIVFLADTCSARSGRQPGELVELGQMGLADSVAKPLAWPVKGAGRLPAIALGRQLADAADAEERNRLLYVAMTRARDRLYVTGFEGRKGRDRGCWYDLIGHGLAGLLEETSEEGGVAIRRLQCQQVADPEEAREVGHVTQEPLAVPEWARNQAPRELQLTIPVAPSRLAPYDIDETGEPAPHVGDVSDKDADGQKIAGQDGAGHVGAGADREPDFPSPIKLSGDSRFLRGTLTHALFEHLPTLDAADWEAAAAGFVETRGLGLRRQVRDSIVAETLAVLRNPSFSAVFGRQARAEVPIVAVIPPPTGKGPALRLNGQIDRLVVSEHEILIVDYKTNRPPPAEPEDVAVAYLVQLAAYRLALGRIYPGRVVKAAILWTDGARLMEIPAALLDHNEAVLWQTKDRGLDAA